MSLPILSELSKNPEPREDKTCGPHNCLTCPAYSAIDPRTGKAECDGCTNEYRDNICNKAVCQLQCRGCGGLGGLGDNTMAACGRPHSLRNTWYEEVGGFSFDWTTMKPQQRLAFKSRFIPMLNAQAMDKAIPVLFPQVKLWGINVGRIFSKSGQARSQDFKDYLGLAKDQQLLLSFNAPEDWMEMAWRRSDSSYAQFNVDYWMPIYLSVPTDDCKFMQHFNCKRVLMSMVNSGAHFMTPKLGRVKSPDWYAPAASKVKNLAFSLVHGFDKTAWLRYRKDVSSLLSIFHPAISLFFENTSERQHFEAIIGDELMLKIARLPYHAIGKSWFMSAARGGHILDPDMKKKVATREEVAIINLDYSLRTWGENETL